MVDFNPQIADVGAPNYTGFSQGTGVDESLSSLFAGLAKAGQQAVIMKDEQTQLQIEEDARQGFDSINEEFGLTPPTGMQSELERIESLQLALEQGKISETNYYSRLATLSKQLRAKYPRYEGIVDQKIQQVTGTRPANAYRDALFAEMNQIASSASDEAKWRRSYIKENEAEIAMIFGPDFFENPDAYDFDKVRVEVTRMKAGIEQRRQEMNELDYEQKLGQVNDRKVERTMSRMFSFTVDNAMNLAMGANGPSFNQKMQEFMAGNVADVDGFITSMGTAESQVRAELMKQGQQFIARGLATQEQVNKAIENALIPIQEIKKAVLGGDFTYAGKVAMLNKQVAEKALDDIFRASPEARIGAGLSKLNSDFGAEYLNRNASAIDQSIDSIGKEVVGRVYGGIDVEAGKRAIESGNNQLAVATIEQSLDVLKQDRVPTQGMSNVVDFLFGNSGPDFMDPRVVDPDDMETIYRKFLDPKITENIKKYGTKEDLDKYTSWALEKALSIPAFRAATGDFNAIIREAPGNLDRPIPGLEEGQVVSTDNPVVKYDPGTNRIVVDLPSTPDAIKDFRMKPYRRAINAVNSMLEVLDPIAEANGATGPELMETILRQLSVKFDGQNGGLFEQIENAIKNPEMGATGDDASDAEHEVSEIDFQYEAEEYDPLEELDDDYLDTLAASYAPAQEKARGVQAVSALASGDMALGNREGTGRENLGLGNLVASRARGYDPDLKNLRPALTTKVAELQSAWGRPLPIVSGFRDAKRNKKAGGAKKSQHMHGNAVDIDVRNLSREERIELIKMARKMGFGGVGVYPNSLHFDIGPKRAWGPNYYSNSLPKWAREIL